MKGTTELLDDKGRKLEMIINIGDEALFEYPTLNRLSENLIRNMYQKEEILIKCILEKHIGRPPVGDDFSKVVRRYKKDESLEYSLWYAEELLGNVSIIMNYIDPFKSELCIKVSS